MLASLLDKVARREDLSSDEAEFAMHEIMEGRATSAQVGGLLVGLVMKGERPAELAGLARAMRAEAVKLGRTWPCIDVCGTGGDRAGTFNVSSVVAVVVAACGVPVAKHGNRAVSSQSGSADVFEALGVRTAAEPAIVDRCLEQAGLAFLFAPIFHPSMKQAAAVRRELRLRTAFNLLGPLTNPASPRRQLVGVPRADLTELMARALHILGTERAWVVHGADGLDEISTTGYTKVSECCDGSVRTFYVHPHEFGLKVATSDDLRGGTAQENAQLALEILAGNRKSESPKVGKSESRGIDSRTLGLSDSRTRLNAARDIVLLNAGAALFVAGVVENVRTGIDRAGLAIDRGDALQTLAKTAELSRQVQ